MTPGAREVKPPSYNKLHVLACYQPIIDPKNHYLFKDFKKI